jgi:hypothetical protein
VGSTRRRAQATIEEGHKSRVAATAEISAVDSRPA